MDSKGVGGWQDWIYVTQDREMTFAFVNMVMNFQVANNTKSPWVAGVF